MTTKPTTRQGARPGKLPAASPGDTPDGKPQDAIASTPTHKPYKRDYNRKRVVALTEQGLNPAIIAKDQGVAISTITRYLAKIGMQQAAVRQYSSTKADALCLSQLKMQAISDHLIDNWLADPDKLTSQDLRLQKEILVAVQGAKTYEHTAERLERGESTVNLSQLVGKVEDMQRIRAGAKSDSIEEQAIE